jgi:hypothetical protein
MNSAFMKIFAVLRVWIAPWMLVAFLAAKLTAGVPDWLVKAAAQPCPKYAKDVPGVVLLDEMRVTIEADGRQTVVHRYAMKVLNQTGREHAVGKVPFLDKEDSPSTFGPWVLRNGKEVKPDKKIGWSNDSSTGKGEVFSEVRTLRSDYSEFVLTDDVFGYETTVDRRVSFSQDTFDWSSELAVIKSSLFLQLPPGWTMTSLVTGPKAGLVQTEKNAQGQAWMMLDVPYHADEPEMPENARMDALLMLTYFPSGAAASQMLPAFRSWSELGKWLYALQDGQCDSNAAIQETAHQLTASAVDENSKIRALGSYVQNLRYLAYDKGLSKGYGYRPRKATEVLAKGWGDCKAKANLLRSMLRSIGIESYMVQVNSKTGRSIEESWPAPHQFNHAILAIKVSEAVSSPAIAEVQGLGRLLFFDVTDPYVMAGDLPARLQGGRVHVVAPENNLLTVLPIIPPETGHIWNHKVHMELSPTGGVVGDCYVGGAGESGAFYRSMTRNLLPKEINAKLANQVGAAVSGAIISDIVTTDDPVSGECSLKFHFSGSRFAQMMPGGLEVVRLDVLSRDSAPAFPAKERNFPIELKMGLAKDEVTLKLSAGIVVDELPEHTELKSKYGSYESSYTVANGAIVVRRTLKLEGMTVPATEYAALRKFFADVAKADHASVVLRQGE